MMRSLVLLVALTLAPAAHAQLRTIPKDAKRAEIRSTGQMGVEINGKRTQLSAGAQVRDANNMIIVPTAIPAGAKVKYLLDTQGRVFRVWILSPQEEAQPDAK